MRAIRGGGYNESPLTSYLVNAGRNLLEEGDCDSGEQIPGLLPVPASHVDIRGQFPEGVLQGLTCGSTAYAVPLSLHQNNHYFYNRRRATEGACVCSDGDADQLIDWLKCLSGNGKKTVIALPNTSSCVAACGGPDSEDSSAGSCMRSCAEPLQFLFENLLLLESGADGYVSSWRQFEGAQEGEDLGVVHTALRLLDRVRPYINNGLSGEGPATLDDAAELVRDGVAAMMVMPDWFEPGVEDFSGVRHGRFPGTYGFLFTVDAFAAPDVEGQWEASYKWWGTLLDRDTQVEFAIVKNAVPALKKAQERMGLRLGRFIPAMEASLTDWKKEDRLLDALLEWGMDTEYTSKDVLQRLGAAK